MAKLNLQGKAKYQYKKLQPAPIDSTEMKSGIQQKFGDVDMDDLKMKFDGVKQ